jgi:hypothetical protein
MKSFSTALVGIALLVATCVVGAVHGQLTNRWGPQPDLVAAGTLLEKMPQEIAGWVATSELPLEDNVVEMLQCKGSVSRVYEHPQTGERISVAVLLGPSGPIAVHTPEICYSSKDFRITSDRHRWSVSDTEELWDLRLKSNDAIGSPLRVLYGWTNDRYWHATKYPRFAYGGRPLLYKIQLAGPVPIEGKRDAMKEFLAAFLPVLREHLIDPSQASSSKEK